MSFKSHTIRGKAPRLVVSPSACVSTAMQTIFRKGPGRGEDLKSHKWKNAPHPQPILWLNTERAYQSLGLNLAPRTLNVSWLTPPGSCVFRTLRGIPFGVNGLGLSVLSRLPCVSCPKQEIFCRTTQSDPIELATS